MITSNTFCSVIRWAGLGLLLGTLSLTSRHARAETNEQRAIRLFETGRKLARDGRCPEAIAPLLESVRYAEGVGPLLNLGNCYVAMGKSASALRWFERAREVAAARGDARWDEAAQRARAIEKDVPLLVVHVSPSIRGSAEVRVDGESWPQDRWDSPQPIDPGPHQMEVTVPPHPKHTETLIIPPKGERVEWTAPASLPATKAPPAAFEPAPVGPSPERKPIQRTLGLVTGGAGVGGLVAGAIFGVISISEHASLVGRCPGYPTCPSSDRAALDPMNERADSAGTISTIAIVTGALLLTAGAILLFTAPAAAPQRER
jgi:hypothetical protein